MKLGDISVTQLEAQSLESEGQVGIPYWTISSGAGRGREAAFAIANMPFGMLILS